MGMLLDGSWDAAATPATYDRERYGDPDSFDGQVGDARHPPAADRYHLYVSRACPWAHRAALVRRLAGLTGIVSVDVVDPVRRDRGWEFTPAKEGCTPDSVGGRDTLADVYRRADPAYTGRVTVPILYDREADTVVAVAGGGFPLPALEHLRSVARALDAWVLPGQVAIPNAHEAFDEAGPTDEAIADRLDELGADLVDYAGVESYPESTVAPVAPGAD